jgi:hypothetical protein
MCLSMSRVFVCFVNVLLNADFLAWSTSSLLGNQARPSTVSLPRPVHTTLSEGEYAGDDTE